jgi:tetratricopeptide (TPR) repeat protein
MRLGRRLQAGLGRVGLGLALVVVLGGTGIVLARDRSGGPASPAGAQPAKLGRLGTGHDVAGAVARAQQRLAQVPGDWTTWAELGVAYVQQARVTGDPSYYPKADGVLRRSLQVRPTDNAVALAGLGTLAAARHDFTRALRYGEQAVRLDDASAIAWGVVTDANVELGRYDAAAVAVQRMLDIRPDTGSLTRASYLLELHGDLAGARRMLDQALSYAPSSDDAGFVLYYLGELAWNAGDLATAQARYSEGLRRAPSYLPLLEGMAKVAAARGERATALAGYRTVVTRLPLPAYLVEYGDLLAATADRAGAGQQYGVLRVQQRLAASYGVNVDLDLALFDADHATARGATDRGATDQGVTNAGATGQGTARQAVSEAAAALRQRPGVLGEDAYAWALHAAGRNAEALPHARRALRLGTRSAAMLYHLGTIEAAVGHAADARRHLAAALATNPHFNPVQAPRAQALLARLGGSG